MDVIILILGIIICIFLMVYFYISDLGASVFPEQGFADDEILIEEVKLERHFSFTYFSDKK